MSVFRRCATVPFFDYLAHDRRLGYLRQITGEYAGNTPEELESMQVARFWELARTAYRNCPFYRKRYDEAGVNPFELKSREEIAKLPTIDKSDIYNHMDEMINSAYDRSSLLKSATGGTTAAPMNFYLTRDAWCRRRGATLFFKKWFGYVHGGRQAYLWGAPQDVPQGMSWRYRLKNYLTENSLMLFSSYLNEEVMADYCRRLKAFRPTTLQAYPTPLAILSEFMLKNSITLSIPGINVTAEPLYEHQREVIEEAFKTRIFNWYGARELGHVATECTAHDGLHVNTWGTLVETLADGKPVTECVGEIVVTELFNDGMPFIRYRNGDLGTITNKSCSCGFPAPRIMEIEGRVGDVIRKRDGTFLPGVSFSDRVLTHCRSISHLQVVQKDFDLFELVVVKGAEYSDLTISEIKKTMSDYLRFEPRFIVTYVESIPPEKSGKIRFIKNEMSA